MKIATGPFSSWSINTIEKCYFFSHYLIHLDRTFAVESNGTGFLKQFLSPDVSLAFSMLDKETKKNCNIRKTHDCRMRGYDA